MVQVPEGLFERIIFLIQNYYPILLSGIMATIVIAFIGTIVGTLLGCLIAFLRGFEVHYKDGKVTKFFKKFLKFIATAYIDIVRGTPMIVQAMIVFYGLAQNGIQLAPIVAGLIVVSFNTAAYIAEIIRSGINALDPGQLEGARSIGMSKFKAMKLVVFPQVFRNSLPSLMNELIINIKDSSVLSVIGVVEIFNASKSAATQYYLNFESMILAAFIYLVLTICLTKTMNYYERKMLSPKNSVCDITDGVTV